MDSHERSDFIGVKGRVVSAKNSDERAMKRIQAKPGNLRSQLDVFCGFFFGTQFGLVSSHEGRPVGVLALLWDIPVDGQNPLSAGPLSPGPRA